MPLKQHYVAQSGIKDCYKDLPKEYKDAAHAIWDHKGARVLKNQKEGIHGWSTEILGVESNLDKSISIQEFNEAVTALETTSTTTD